MIVTIELEKPLTNKEIERLAKENNLNVTSEIRKGKQYIYLHIEDDRKV